MTIRKNTSLLAAILSLAVAFGLLSRVVPVHAEDTHNTRFRTPFKHVVVIFQENRTPDNLFQGYASLLLVTVIHAALPRRSASTIFPLPGGSINIRPPG
jgi:hypothetical protein